MSLPDHPNNNPYQICITNDDIDQIATLFNCKFDDCHRRVLICNTSQDIQACPGSGKTTLLVAKLSALAKKWQWQDQGICVLSHTNVARKEIEKRLARDPIGCSLLEYPHFIGTFQVFVDQFLAYPFLLNNPFFKDKDMGNIKVNDDLYEKVALRYFREHSADFKYYLSPYRDPDMGYKVVKGLRYGEYIAPSFKLISNGNSIPSETSDTYKALKKLKNHVFAQGICCYEDMFAFAEAYIKDYAQVINFMRIRFPWVFIDEMQDTNPRQNALIKQIFGEGCILQRFGDINQAIFGEVDDYEAGLDFPCEQHLELPISQRFGQKIATFASSLTAKRRQELQGNPTFSNPVEPNRSHTIFLFDPQSITNVLKQFALVLFEAYPNGFSKDFTAKAVGFRKSDEGAENREKLPFSLGSYWPGFKPELLHRSHFPDYLVDYIRKARHVREEQGSCKEPYDILINGVLEYLYRQGARYKRGGKSEKFNRTRLIDELERSSDLFRMQFYDFLTQWCLPETPLNEDYWRSTSIAFRDFFSGWSKAGEYIKDDAYTFLMWKESEDQRQTEGSRLSKDLLNIYTYQEAGLSARIELATIHAVKGETHSATLVLETYFNRTHDLKMLIPFLAGCGNYNDLRTNSKLLGHMKRIFVAMTRPRDLLCLAMNKHHIDNQQRYALLEKGWHIIDVA